MSLQKLCKSFQNPWHQSIFLHKWCGRWNSAVKFTSVWYSYVDTHTRTHRRGGWNKASLWHNKTWSGNYWHHWGFCCDGTFQTCIRLLMDWKELCRDLSMETMAEEEERSFCSALNDVPVSGIKDLRMRPTLSAYVWEELWMGEGERKDNGSKSERENKKDGDRINMSSHGVWRFAPCGPHSCLVTFL